MQIALDDLLGCAHGRVTRLAPQTRLIAGGLVLASCLLAPTSTLPGVLCLLAATSAWAAACGPSMPVAGPLLLFGLTVALPVFLLVPINWISEPQTTWGHAALAPWSVFVRSMTGLVVTVSTLSTLSATSLRQGLHALPVPYPVSMILLQVVRQSAELLRESRRVAAAIAVRGASTKRGAALSVLASLPTVWMRRLLGRAVSQAWAMELRGYCDVDLRTLHGPRPGWQDYAVIVATLALVGTAGALRWRWRT